LTSAAYNQPDHACQFVENRDEKMASPHSVHIEEDEAVVFCLLIDNDSEMTESEAFILLRKVCHF